MKDLVECCRKYINNDYTIGDLSRILSYVGTPNDISQLVNEAEYKIECIRFTIDEQNQYVNCLKVICEMFLGISEKYDTFKSPYDDIE